MNPLRIAIHGAAGRMGSRLVALAAADEGLSLAAALESPRHPRLGEDAGIVAGTGELGVGLSGSLDVGGKIEVESELGAGSRFIVTLPILRLGTGQEAS